VHALTFLGIALVLVAAKVASLIERYEQPAVLGELVMGVALGNLGLIGIHAFEFLRADSIIGFLAELGVVILLFQVGLESNIEKMRSVGIRAFLVAIVGVVVPFVLGTYLVGPWLIPGLTDNAYLFLGATLTATSVGITARVFKDLGKLHMRESQIVLGAAVIDDVIGLIILAVVSAIVTVGAVSAGGIALITLKAVAFLVGAIVIGQMTAQSIGDLFSKIHSGIGMKFTLAISICLIFAWAASLIGLAPIVGAFAAGLVLDSVHFRRFKSSEVIDSIRERIARLDEKSKKEIEDDLELHSHRHIESLIEPLAFFVVPIFFVMTGMGVRLETLADPTIIGVALGITAIAFIGKIVAGAVAGNVNKWLVGWGMVPRGEVGLIFVTIGKWLGVVNDELFSIVVIMIILSTLLTPPVLSYLLKRAG
jgi:Kef-type K+ transport system membrane component KefB